MPHGYTDEEFSLFTKTERRIIGLIENAKYGKEEIMAALDFKAPTFRGHMANIKRKRAQIHTTRYEALSKEEAVRMQEKQLPDFKVKEDEEALKEEQPEEEEIVPTPPSERIAQAPSAFLPTDIPLEKMPADDSILPRLSRREPIFGSF